MEWGNEAGGKKNMMRSEHSLSRGKQVLGEGNGVVAW